MRRRRWPDGADDHRRAAIQAIKVARGRIDEARKLARIDPHLQQLLLADANADLSDAINYLLLARMGEKDED